MCADEGRTGGCTDRKLAYKNKRDVLTSQTDYLLSQNFLYTRYFLNVTNIYIYIYIYIYSQ